MKLCAFSLGAYPCGFGAEEEVAELLKADPVQILSHEAREKNGEDGLPRSSGAGLGGPS